MRKFRINYMVPGLLTMLPLYKRIIADNEEDAKKEFIKLYPKYLIAAIKDVTKFNIVEFDNFED